MIRLTPCKQLGDCMPVLIFILITTLISQVSLAAPINAHMHDISVELEKLSPYLFKEEKFSAPQNEKFIKEYLQNLVTKFKDIKKHPDINTPGYKFSRNQIEVQLKESIEIFSRNHNSYHKEYARHKLNSTFGLCISCHTQLSTGDKLKIFGSSQLDGSITDPFEKAEYYFITRDFTKALENYDLFINQFDQTKERKNLETALNHKLTYYLRIQRNKNQEAIASFTQNLNNKNLPLVVREQISEWIKELGMVQFFTFSGKTISEKEMKKFIAEVTKENEDGPRLTLYSKSEVKDLRISGLLYEYLNAHPHGRLVPEILYNLAIIDKHMNFSLFYSLGDLYLIECMTRFSQLPIAKSCYKEYEEEKILSYTGSSGTSLPEEVSKELNSYKEKIWKKDK